MKDKKIFKIEYGLAGGFSGNRDSDIIVADSQHEAELYAIQKAIITYQRLEGKSGLLDYSQFCYNYLDNPDQYDKEAKMDAFKNYRSEWLYWKAIPMKFENQ